MTREPGAQESTPHVAKAGKGVTLAEAHPVRKRVSRLFLFTYTVANFGLSLATLMPALFTLAYKMQIIAPESKAASLGIVISIGAVVTFISTPVVGVLSDRTTSKFGRRRPWMVVGIVAVAAGSTLIAVAASVGLVIIGWCLVTFGLASLQAAIGPVIAEQVPDEQRGKAGALTGVAIQLAGVAGSLVGALLIDNMLLMFLLPAIILAVVSVAYFLVIPDRPAVYPEGAPRPSIGKSLAMLVFNPLKHRDFSLVWIGKLLFQMAMAILSTYQLYFVMERLGFTPEEAGTQLAAVGGIGILVTTGMAVLGGVISDRLRRRKPFIYAVAALAATGFVLLAFTSSLPLYIAGSLFILAAAGIFGSVDLALVADVLPDKQDGAGRWMGIYHTSTSIANATTPILAAVLLSIGSPTGSNYTVLFFVAAGVAGLIALSTSRIRSVR